MRICCTSAAEPPRLLLPNVNVVLVAPKEPGNIGAALRVAANHGAGGLTVVAPRCDPLGPDVHRFACQSPLLDTMQVLPTLRDALADKMTSVGLTRRAGGGRVTHPSLRALATTFPSVAAQMMVNSTTGEGQAALVYGREESGLTQDEVALCAHAAAIPSNPDFPSLNLSHAVAVTLSTLLEMKLTAEESAGDAAAAAAMMDVAPQGEVEALLARAVALMEAAGLDARESSGGGDKSNHGRRRRPAGHLRALLARSQATTSEVRAMHGILKELEKRNAV